MKLVLLGYMGSGKSLIGSLLSEVLGYEFVDLDDYIETQENLKISDIFLNKGELYFRKQEKKYLEALLQTTSKTIISLGGGTPCYFDTMDVLTSNKAIKTIYLKVPIQTLSERLYNEKDKRPLITHLDTQEEVTEFIGKHLFERAPYYSKAEFSIDAEDSPNAIVEKIIATLVSD